MERKSHNYQQVNVQDEHGLTMLHKSAMKGSVIEVTQLLNEGSDPNIQDEYGLTVLHRVIEHIENEKVMIEMVKLLLSQSADPNKQDTQGMTALHYALWQKKIKVLKLLLDNGGDRNILTLSGKTVLDIAKAVDDKDAVNLLLE